MIIKSICSLLALGVITDASSNNINWMSVGQSVILFVIGVLTAWNNWRQGKTESKLDLVHAAVNSGLGEQLRIANISAQTLAGITHDPTHIELAGVAQQKYDLHVRDQNAQTNLANKSK